MQPKKYQVLITGPMCLSSGGTGGGGTSLCLAQVTGQRQTHRPVSPAPAEPRQHRWAAARGGIREAHGMDPSCEDCVSGHRRCLLVQVHKGVVKTDPWAGAFEPAQEELIATDGRDGAETPGNRRLTSFARVPGARWVGPCRGTAHPPRPRSVMGWIHRGSQLAEQKKQRSWCEWAKTQELLSWSSLRLGA